MVQQPRRRKTGEELGQELQRIYADPGGQMPDFSKMEGKKHNRLVSILSWALFFVIALSGVSFAGYFFFLRPTSFTGDRALVQVSGPDSLTAGGESDITLTYRNDEHVPLASATVSVELPKSFVEISSDPPPDQNGRWPIGSLAPGAQGHITIKGWTRGTPGSTLTFRSTLSYKPADFNSEFQKVSEWTVVIGGSAMTVSATTTSAEAVPGDQTDFLFRVQNTSDRPIDGLEFRTDPVDGFVFASSTPQPETERTDRWNLGTIAPGMGAAITVHGTFSTAARGPKTLGGAVGFPDADGFTAIASASATTEVQKSDLSVSMIVNGSNAPPAVSFGDTLYFSLNWKNTGDVPLKNVTLDAELPSQPAGGDLLDWVSLKDDAGGARKGSTITWTSKQVPDLAGIAPGADGTINFSVPLIKHAPPASASSATSTPFAVNVLVRGEIPKLGKIPAHEVVSTPLPIQLNSDTVFKAYGRYYDDSGVPLGSGPIPPKAGALTTYRVFWVVSNTLHELSNLTISTVLPDGVTWTGVQREVDAGALTFDSTGRKATWQLNKLPTSVQQIVVSFDVQVTPTLQDVGSILPLTGDSHLEALDKVTQSVILKTEQPVASDLLGDETAAGKGIVRE